MFLAGRELRGPQRHAWGGGLEGEPVAVQVVTGVHPVLHREARVAGAGLVLEGLGGRQELVGRRGRGETEQAEQAEGEPAGERQTV